MCVKIRNHLGEAIEYKGLTSTTLITGKNSTWLIFLCRPGWIWTIQWNHWSFTWGQSFSQQMLHVASGPNLKHIRKSRISHFNLAALPSTVSHTCPASGIKRSWSPSAHHHAAFSTALGSSGHGRLISPASEEAERAISTPRPSLSLFCLQSRFCLHSQSSLDWFHPPLVDLSVN